MSRRARSWTVVAALLGVSMLGGCGYWEKDKPPPLPGERKSVLLLDDSVKADPSLAEMQIALPPPAGNREWPQPGGSATHAMYHLDAAASLQPAWSASIGPGSGEDSFLNRPIVVGDRLFAVNGQAEIVALSTTNGSQVWRMDPPDLPDADRLNGGGIASDGSLLFLTTAKGVVLALDLASGREVWRHDLVAPLRGSPSVADGKVLVISADNQSFALDAASGDVVWQHTAPGDVAAILGGSSPAVAQGIAIVPYASGEVVALSMDSGLPVWSDSVQRPRRTLAIAAINDIDGLPVIDRDRVLVGGTGGEIAAFDLPTGNRLYEVMMPTNETPWAAGDFVYALSDRGELVCLLRADGRVRWVSAMPRERSGDRSGDSFLQWVGPVLVKDRLLVGSSDGELLSVSPYTGEILGRLELGAAIRQAPIVADGVVYLLTEDGTVHAFR